MHVECEQEEVLNFRISFSSLSLSLSLSLLSLSLSLSLFFFSSQAKSLISLRKKCLWFFTFFLETWNWLAGLFRLHTPIWKKFPEFIHHPAVLRSSIFSLISRRKKGRIPNNRSHSSFHFPESDSKNSFLLPPWDDGAVFIYVTHLFFFSFVKKTSPLKVRMVCFVCSRVKVGSVGLGRSKQAKSNFLHFSLYPLSSSFFLCPGHPDKKREKGGKLRGEGGLGEMRSKRGARRRMKRRSRVTAPKKEEKNPHNHPTLPHPKNILIVTKTKHVLRIKCVLLQSITCLLNPTRIPSRPQLCIGIFFSTCFMFFPVFFHFFTWGNAWWGFNEPPVPSSSSQSEGGRRKKEEDREGENEAVAVEKGKGKRRGKELSVSWGEILMGSENRRRYFFF